MHFFAQFINEESIQFGRLQWRHCYVKLWRIVEKVHGALLESLQKLHIFGIALRAVLVSRAARGVTIKKQRPECLKAYNLWGYKEYFYCIIVWTWISRVRQTVMYCCNGVCWVMVFYKRTGYCKSQRKIYILKSGDLHGITSSDTKEGTGELSEE